MSNQDVTEDEVISIFLKAEVDSSRFGPTILHLLRERGLDRKIIDQPNLHDKKENLSRADILGVYRGYGRNQFLFAKFPRNVNWQRIQCDQASLEQIRYVDCTPWRELSGGTLRIADAAERIRNGLEDSATTGTIISTIRETARALKSGRQVAEVILVADRLSPQRTAIEGHNRLTAFLLNGIAVPLSVILGTVSDLSDWRSINWS